MRPAAFVACALLLFAPAALAQGDADGCAAPAAAAGAPPLPAPATPRLKVGIALGSGSMHGLAHIGVLQELEARGLEVRVVAGTSIGAVIGGLWASGYSGRQIEELSRRSDWEDVGQFAISWQGLFSNENLRRQLEALFGGRAIETWPRTFGAVATNVSTGTRRVLSRGDAATAIQASSAVPVLFTPV
ncbi:MAG TPA: patatin-like phospholipase family protein, partial [Myxococcota bacterium]|nr:patatin-like phospholipase family protein [Myxococcota bacterium]